MRRKKYGAVRDREQTNEVDGDFLLHARIFYMKIYLLQIKELGSA